jgi:hypothetical protein
MTDRIKGFTVVLEKDLRDDDFEAIKNAVLMIRGVASIETSDVDASDWMNRERVRLEYRQKILDVVLPRPAN